MTVRTLLIGLDGATFTVLDPFMERGLMPFLRDLVGRGVRAPLRTVLPPLTPPGWTSLATGKRPGQHGVFDFFQKQAPDSEYFRFTGSEDVQSATIWSLASDQGRRVSVLNFPVTFPPPIVNGCVVPGGWMPWRQLRLGCHPPGLFDRLKTLPSFNARELEEKVVEGCAAEEYADWIALHIRRERRWLEIARYLLREEPSDLVGLVFDGVDKLQHLCWRFLAVSPEASAPASAWELEIRGLCEAYFRQLDEIIAELVELAGPEAMVVLASDHGAGPATSIFCVNTWLEQQGYLSWASDVAPQPDGSARLGIRTLTSHIQQLDWERTVAYAATPSSQGIQIVKRRPDGTELSPEACRQLRDELAAALRQLRHPQTGQPAMAEVWTREQAFAGPHAALAPDITIIPADGGVVSILRSDTPFKGRPEIGGSHRWEGIFVAAGPGVRAGVRLPELSIVDVAPLLLYSLDLPLPDDLDGRLPVEALEPDELERRPPLAAAPLAAAALPRLASPEAGLSPDEEALILKRLSALGYVE